MAHQQIDQVSRHKICLPGIHQADQESISNVVVTVNISCETLVDSVYDRHSFAKSFVPDSSTEGGINDFFEC
jgi:hypothetical protein